MIESIGKLRDSIAAYAAECDEGWLLSLVDEIEREIAEKFMELPVDADGVPIRVGDVLQYGDYSSGIVKALNGCMVIAMHVDDDNLNYAKYGMLWDAEGCRHVKPRTIEDVLREFAEKAVCGNQYGSLYADEEEIAKYADELRVMMGVDR